MKSLSLRGVAFLAFLAILMAGIIGSAAGAAPQRGHYVVVLKDSVERPGSVARGQTDYHDGDVGFVYTHALNGYSATLPDGAVEAIERNPKVAFVTVDHQVNIQEEEVELDDEDNGEVEVLESKIPTGIKRTFATSNSSLDIDGVDDVRVNADVAVIDTGIDSSHPDLDVEGRTNCVPEDKNAETKKCIDNSGTDGHSHGTHVAGTIGAIDNSIGVVGMAPGARLWAVKVLSDGGSGSESWVLAGVDWVTAHASTIEVANMSLGCACELPALSKGITKSVEAGVVYAVAAGNNNSNASGQSPANNPDVITVSAIADYDGKPGGEGSQTCLSGTDDKKAGFSNYGSTVEVAAPGVCILSTVPGGAYGTKSGTSMASPHVAGAAAILAAQANPDSKADVEAIRSMIIAEGNSGWTDSSPDGIKEPLLDVGDPFPGQEPTATTNAASGVMAGGATVRGTVKPNGLATTYQFEYGTTTSYGTKAPASPKGIGSGTSNVEVSEAVSGLKAGTTYHFRVVATNEKGTTAGKDETFSTPSATTKWPSQILDTRAKLNGAVNPNGLNGYYQFEYGLAPAVGEPPAYEGTVPATPQSIGSGTSDVEVSQALEGLQPETRYRFRVVLYEGGEPELEEVGEPVAYGGDEFFYTHTVGPEAPVVAYSFDEGSGNTLHDSVGSNSSATGYDGINLYNGKIEGATWTASGKYGSALDFDGTDDRVLIEDPAGGLDLTDYFTISAWVRPDTTANWTPVIGNRENSGGESGYVLFARANGKPEGNVASSGTSKGVVGSSALPAETWSHIAFTSDGTYLRLYVNGELVASESAIAAKGTKSFLEIGHSILNNSYFDGKIDELRIYDAPLSQAEIQIDRDQPVGLKRMPRAAYSFDENSGATLHDSARSHDGTIEGATWTSGISGSALDFDGTNDTVTVVDTADLDLGSTFTVQAWVNPDVSEGTVKPLIVKTAESNGYGLYSRIGTKPIASVTKAGTSKSVFGTTALPTGTWSHLAMTSDGTNLRLYVNGKLDASTEATGAGANSASLSIGSSGTGYYFDGKIDNVRIYDTTLSQSLIRADRNRPVGLEQTPVAVYSFDENSGTTLHDSARDYDGTIEGATWTSGFSNYALDFDGTNDVVTIPDTADLDLGSTFTLQAWLRPDTTEGNSVRTVVGKFGESNGYRLWSRILKSPVGSVTNAGTSKSVTGTSALPAGTWSHLAMTSDGTNLRLYVNGELISTGAAIAAGANSASLLIGGANGSGYFDGKIDELKIWDETRTQAQIEAEVPPEGEE